MSSTSGDEARASTFDRGRYAATEVIRMSISPFAAPPGQPRTRRATDVVILVPSLLVLAYLVAVYPPSTLELALIRALEAFPGWLEPVWAFLEYLVGVWAFAILLAALVVYRLATFCLPPIWGFVALRRLQSNRYL